MAKTPPRRDTSESDHICAKTVVTSINKITDRPPGKEACLVVIYGFDWDESTTSTPPTLVIGRSSKSDIQIDQESVSRAHAKIINTGKSIRIRDLGSTNGTYVNDELIEEHVLARRRPHQDRPHHLQVPLGRQHRGAYHEEIYRLTTIDGLTQIYNKRYFLETLEREIARCQPLPARAVAGHVRHRPLQADQRHLRPPRRRPRAQAAGAIIKAKIRREDMLARYGGEEFAIVLPGDRRLQRPPVRREGPHASSRPPTSSFEETKIPVTVSMGVATLDADTADAAALIKRADERLYEAKGAGRNCVRG